jgi:hypothetical protein
MVELGIKTPGLTKAQIVALEESVAGAIEVNENNRKIEMAQASFDIQRRGQNLPGDTGKNFGLFADDIHGRIGNLGPFSETYPGSYFFGGFFGGNGIGSGFGGHGGAIGLGGHGLLGQGSHASFKRNTQLSHQKMAMCVSAYKGFGLAKNVIDLMANFAAEGLKIKHPNKTVERFLNRWAHHVDLNCRVKDILRYYYKYGNVFVYKTFGDIDENAYLKMRRSKAKASSGLPGFTMSVDIDPVKDPQQTERVKDAQKESQKPLPKKKIPWRYTLLIPFQMELRGTKFFGGQRWVFVLDNNTLNDIRTSQYTNKSAYIDFLDETDVNLPQEFKKLSTILDKDAPSRENNDPRIVELDQKKLHTMHYMKDDHEDWAEPLLWPVMADIFYKNKLRQMDISVCNSVINAVTIYKLGNFKEGFIVPKAQMDKFSEFLRTPSQSLNMVWNDAISIESSYPPVERILGIAKYESVDRDILRGIGIPDTLIGGQVKSNFSTGFLGVRTLLERLEEGRNTVIRWLMKELELVVAILGIRKMPSIRFGKMSLRDEKAEKQLVLQLLDRNIISIQAVLETFGEEFEIELQRLKEEELVREESGLFQKHSPYTDPINDLGIEEQMQKEADFKMQEQRLSHKFKLQENKSKEKSQPPKKNAKAPNGRPGNSDGIPQEKKRDTKPQGMAWFLEYENVKAKAIEHIDYVEHTVSLALLKATGKKNKRSLTKHQSEGLEAITFAIASQTNFTEKVNVDSIKNILATSPTINGDMYAVYDSMTVKDMSLQDRKIAMASAIAYCRLQGE